ncbi:MAG: methionine--tRNA ligase [Planctomycetes bacterium]|nr:methionine--tRNA ligase [Planctomycetota bacterium]
MTRYLVTSALPYANGPIHFGHVVGAYLPADVYARTLRMQGEEVLFVCGTDEHGVAITIGAEKEGVPYAEYVAKWRAVIKSTFDALGLEFDIWSGTSICPQHAPLSQDFFRRIDRNGYLLQRAIEQLYCPTDRMFLADRYVVGTCPNCAYPEARGDECPRCAKWIDPLDPKYTNVRCKVCGSTPEKRSTRHWYLDLPKIRDEFLGRWVAEHEWKPNVGAFVENQMKEIEPRPITRDMSWGVPLPADTAGDIAGKVLYVWFDAPIGYVSFTREWAERRGRPDEWQRWWQSSDTRLVHFIGKDNIPFHCVVFPAMLFATNCGFVLPWHVPANEFYNLQGRKFSTSQGWTIPLDEFFARFDAQAARFYLLSSAPETKDSEWNWKDFQNCVNASLADAIGNLVTRVLKFAAKNHGGAIPRCDASHEAELDRVLLSECGPFGDPGEHVRAFKFRRAAEQLVENARVANKFVDLLAPWSLQKTDPVKAASVLATSAEWIAYLARWMAPFMPAKAQAIWTMLGQEGQVTAQGWPKRPSAGSWRTGIAGSKLGEVVGLFPKLDDKQILAEIAALEARGAGH